jgi:O-methyltransferase
MNIVEVCQPYTMISVERLLQNIQSIDHVQSAKIPGDIVEIGVWKGGSMLAMIKQYETYEEWRRGFHLYDTFTGMTPPSDYDKRTNGTSASSLMGMPGVKAECSLDDVRSTIAEHTSYDPLRNHYHKGDIRTNTVYPDTIAVLRLDTDFYDSTKHELQHFYPRVSKGGIVMIDDYGHWLGCRKAVDEFLQIHPEITLVPIDYTGVYFIKPS